ncbi:hypothetical protein EDD30_3545 [Couchioplanes caeruleus]|uniref:Response regulatory domain-containing protein n=2 Tax=Couchioplanes caeruleus TaxID=56438 RepID=A0A1K0FJ88_9ACTN|nr:hypothetical protein BG844_18230 [Couchioplanes caeruleus subsp. caeruleus]ROP30686.1 hypothetical protein EDD30_3545 [Couchioplanes caeruleus]
MTRILVVDDEPQILRALRINLHARQYGVVTAADGAEACTPRPPTTPTSSCSTPTESGLACVTADRSRSSVA